MTICLIVIGILYFLVFLFIIYSNSSKNVYRPIERVNYSYAEQSRYNSYNRYGQYNRQYGQYGQKPQYRNNPYDREIRVRTESGTEKIKKLDIIEDFSESAEMSAPNKLAGISIKELKNNLTPDNADVLTESESSIYGGSIEEILKRQADKEMFNSVSV